MANENQSDSFVKTAKHAGAMAAETFHDTAVAAKKSANGMGALAEAISSDTKDGVRQVSHALQAESSKVVSLVRASIQERPNLTVGIAAGLGILLGLAMSSRR